MPYMRKAPTENIRRGLTYSKTSERQVYFFVAAFLASFLFSFHM